MMIVATSHYRVSVIPSSLLTHKDVSFRCNFRPPFDVIVRHNSVHLMLFRPVIRNSSSSTCSSSCCCSSSSSAVIRKSGASLYCSLHSLVIVLDFFSFACIDLELCQKFLLGICIDQNPKSDVLRFFCFLALFRSFTRTIILTTHIIRIGVSWIAY